MLSTKSLALSKDKYYLNVANGLMVEWHYPWSFGTIGFKVGRSKPPNH